MLSRFAKLSLAATSVAPIFLTLWFVDFSRQWNWRDGLIYLIATFLLTFICWGLLHLAAAQSEKLPLEIKSVKTADNELVGFILVYLLPLINETSTKINPKVLAFVMVLLFIVVYTSNSYHFNPLIGFLGYHFYDVTLSGEISYVLISRKNIRDSRKIQRVIHLSEYMIMEVE